ncbi:MAG: hypothetical protein LBU36_03675 [Clostridiales bacterium]|nr:hypothetical protein [Clostridiales bacterium]
MLKAPYFKIDEGNAVTIDISRPQEAPAEESAEYGYFEEESEQGELSEYEGITEEEAEKQAKEIIESAVKEAEERAAEIMEEAHRSAEAEAEEILSLARGEAGGIRAEARETGYDEGHAEGSAKAQALIDSAKETLEEAEREKIHILDSSEPQMVDLIIKITEDLVGKAAGLSPEVAALLVKRGLADSTTTGHTAVHVSEDDFPDVSAREKELRKGLDAGGTLEIVKDLSLKQGDCVIETPFGSLDASLDAQFSGLRQALVYLCDNRNN